MDKNLPQVELIASTAQGSVSSFLFSESPDAGSFISDSMNFVGIEMHTVDVALLVLCPILATLGLLVSSLIRAPYAIADPLYKRIFNGLFSNIANLFIGIVVGLIIALFFLGAINNDITSLTKILVLTAFLGYQTPLFWSVKSALRSAPATVTSKKATAPVVLSQDALKLERIKRAKLKLAKQAN
ncbi:MAG: hypothetical protein HRU05_07395 [Oceanospirillaceae bacterium]|nr:hypothetical protein [Oceanospirillaceae bacterium]